MASSEKSNNLDLKMKSINSGQLDINIDPLVVTKDKLPVVKEDGISSGTPLMDGFIENCPLKIFSVDMELPSNRCGIWSWRPKYMQVFRNIRFFVGCMCFVCFLQTGVVVGYFTSQITTLEKRFGLQSSTIGLIQSSFEVGYVFTVILVTYFGSRGRIPVWIASGIIVMAIGSFLFALPQFLPIVSPLDTNLDTNKAVCQASPTSSSSGNAKCHEETNSTWFVIFCFVCAEILIGAGASPLLTLVPPFVDDHVPPDKAPAMIAFLYASTALGPIGGFMIGAKMSQVYVDGLTTNAEALGITVKDPRWIGAWWGGFILYGCFIVVMSGVMYLFPPHLPHLFVPPTPISISQNSVVDAVQAIGTTSMTTANTHEEPSVTSGQLAETKAHASPNLEQRPKVKQKPTSQSTNNSQTGNEPEDGPVTVISTKDKRKELVIKGVTDMTKKKKRISGSMTGGPTDKMKSIDGYGVDWKGLPLAMLNLMTNWVYMCGCAAICFEMFLVNGFASFLPKYIETEFMLDSFTSSILVGGLLVPAGAIGIVVGGLILNHFKFSRSVAILFALAVNVLVLLTMICYIFIGCETPSVAGVTTAYHGQNFSASLTSPCNKACLCPKSKRLEVCYEGTAYISPCFAGCTISNNSGMEQTFTNCSCLPPSSTPAVLRPGICKHSCSTLPYFIILCVVGLFLTGIIQNPVLMVTLRSVQHHERAFALGFQFVILRLLAYLPSPIVYGKVIDLACILRLTVCDQQRDCLVTNLPFLKRNVIALCISLKLGALACYVLLYYLIFRQGWSYGEEFNEEIDKDENGNPPTNIVDPLEVLNTTSTTVVPEPIM